MMTSKYKRLVVTGSLAYDHVMNIPSSFHEDLEPIKSHAINVSFVFDKFRRDFGGSAGNLSHILNLFQIPTVLVGAGGNDFEEYKKHLDQLNFVDKKFLKLYKSAKTASGFVMNDTEGNQIWGFYEGATKYTRGIKLDKIIKRDDLLVIAPNDPVAMIKYYQAAIKTQTDYIFDPTLNIPNIPTINLVEALTGAKIVVGDEYEISQILNRISWSLSKLIDKVPTVITTRGPKGSVICEKEKFYNIKAVKPDKIVSSVGSGIAYRAGFLTGIFRGLSTKESAQIGSLAATYALERRSFQNLNFSINQFKLRYKKAFDKDIEL